MGHLHIFLSCVSSEFAPYREAVRHDLDRPNVTVKIQEDFIAGGGETLAKLDDYIRVCDAVVHFVGDMTGAEALPSSVAAVRARYPDFGDRLPPVARFLEPDAPGMSYTQWEAWLALYHRKALFIAEPTADAPRDVRFVRDDAQRQMQQAHLKRLASAERHPGVCFANSDGLAAQLFKSELLDLLVRAEVGPRCDQALADLSDLQIRFGLASAPTGFRNLVDRFVRLYLGTSKVAVPFGGRDREILAMNAWLNGRPESMLEGNAPALLAGRIASNNLLVHAPAGRGKTALLIRWIAQLDDTWARVFVPVSIRAKTNEELTFYQALASQLAAQLGEPLPQPRVDPAAYYRDKVIEYFERVGRGSRKCLVVIDGLDEARGWRLDTSVLPLGESSTLKVLISARELANDSGARDWLQRLRWTPPLCDACTLAVRRLTREGVANVLDHMRFPVGPLSKDVDIVEELYRLSDGGDPLVLHFYANDLLEQGDRSARLDAKLLRELKPGFAAYIADWLDMQRKEWKAAGEAIDEGLIDAIFAALACAHGPVRLAELEQVVIRIVPGFRIFRAGTVEPLRRFIIGDGLHEGYVLAHPKLATILQEDYFAHTRILVEADTAYREWMRDVVRRLDDGTLAAAKVPSYVLQFQSQHLAAADNESTLDDWAALLNNGWRNAWESHDGGMQGYVRDLESVARALRAAADRDLRVLSRPHVGLGAQVRCALLLSSIRSVGLSASGEMLVEFLRSNRISAARAFHLAHLKPDKDRARTMSTLIQYLPLEMQLQAWASAIDIADDATRSEYLLVVAPVLGVVERRQAYRQALQAAARVQDADRREHLMRALRPHVDPAEFESAQEALAAPAPASVPLVAAPPDSTPALNDMSKLERQAGRKNLTQQGAATIARQIDWRHHRAPMIVDKLGPRLPIEAQRSVLEAALSQPSQFSSDILASLAPHAHPSLLDELVRSIVSTTHFHGSWALDLLAQRFPGGLPLALQRSAIGELRTRGKRFPAEVVEWLAANVHAELLDDLLQVTLETAAWGVAQPLHAIATRPEVPLDHVLDAILAMHRRTYQDEAIGAVAAELSLQQLDRVLDWVIAKDDAPAYRVLATIGPHVNPDRLVALAALASDALLATLLPMIVAFVPVERLTEAVAWAGRVRSPSERTAALNVLLPRLREQGLTDAIAQAFQLAVDVGDHNSCMAVDALIRFRMGWAMPPDAGIGEVPSFKGGNESDDNARVHIILLHARRLTEQERVPLLEELIAAMRGISAPAQRAMMLGIVASRMPRARWSATADEANALARASIDDEGGRILFSIPLALFRPPDEVAAAIERVRVEIALVHDETLRALLRAVVDTADAVFAGAPTCDLLAGVKAVLTIMKGAMTPNQAEAIAAAVVLVVAKPLPADEVASLLDTIEHDLQAIADRHLRAWLCAVTACYVPTPRLWRWMKEVLLDAAQQTRPDALGLLSQLHGLLQEAFAHHPGIGGNRIANWPLARLGGETAVTETLAAIAEARATWP